jgi:hypothetical protein
MMMMNGLPEEDRRVCPSSLLSASHAVLFCTDWWWPMWVCDKITEHGTSANHSSLLPQLWTHWCRTAHSQSVISSDEQPTGHNFFTKLPITGLMIVYASNISSCTDRHYGLPVADFAPKFSLSGPMAYGSLEAQVGDMCLGIWQVQEQKREWHGQAKARRIRTGGQHKIAKLTKFLWGDKHPGWTMATTRVWSAVGDLGSSSCHSSNEGTFSSLASWDVKTKKKWYITFSHLNKNAHFTAYNFFLKNIENTK